MSSLIGMPELLIFAVIFAVLSLACLVRLFKGPTGADRMVAGDSMDILLSCSLLLYALYSGRGIFLDIAIISALLGIIDTMLVGRYLDTGRWLKKK